MGVEPHPDNGQKPVAGPNFARVGIQTACGASADEGAASGWACIRIELHDGLPKCWARAPGGDVGVVEGMGDPPMVLWSRAPSRDEYDIFGPNAAMAAATACRRSGCTAACCPDHPGCRR